MHVTYFAFMYCAIILFLYSQDMTDIDTLRCYTKAKLVGAFCVPPAFECDNQLRILVKAVKQLSHTHTLTCNIRTRGQTWNPG